MRKATWGGLFNLLALKNKLSWKMRWVEGGGQRWRGRAAADLVFCSAVGPGISLLGSQPQRPVRCIMHENGSNTNDQQITLGVKCHICHLSRITMTLESLVSWHIVDMLTHDGNPGNGSPPMVHSPHHCQHPRCIVLDCPGLRKSITWNVLNCLLGCYTA